MGNEVDPRTQTAHTARNAMDGAIGGASSALNVDAGDARLAVRGIRAAHARGNQNDLARSEHEIVAQPIVHDLGRDHAEVILHWLLAAEDLIFAASAPGVFHGEKPRNPLRINSQRLICLAQKPVKQASGRFDPMPGLRWRKRVKKTPPIVEANRLLLEFSRSFEPPDQAGQTIERVELALCLASNSGRQ